MTRILATLVLLSLVGCRQDVDTTLRATDAGPGYIIIDDPDTSGVFESDTDIYFEITPYCGMDRKAALDELWKGWPMYGAEYLHIGLPQCPDAHTFTRETFPLVNVPGCKPGTWLVQWGEPYCPEEWKP